MSSEKILMNAKEAKAMTGTSLPTIYAWTETPGFPVIRVGKKKMIHIEGFKKWIAEQANYNAI